MGSIRGIVVGLAVLGTLAPLPPGRAAAAPGPAPAVCSTDRSPFASTPGSSLTPTEHTSQDAEPVRYVLWRGTVPSFDGLPLSVDMTVPCAATGPLPAVTMLHGFTDDKTVWEETGKSDTVESVDRPGANSRWNNIWFASRGYATLTYTARGWRDSCGPTTPGARSTAPPPQCAGHAYWIHLDDARWEVRDAQWLTAGLVDGGLADADRLAITGGSYGGAPTATAALLADRMMCGADPVAPALGADPCAGVADGELAPWATRGGTPLRWAAAVPMYTFSDLLQVLAPNGRGTDGWTAAPADTSHVDPVGVPLASTLNGLLLAGKATGVFSPPGVDPDSDITTMAGRLLAGDPYDVSDPVVANGIRVSERFRSPVGIEPHGRTPIFWVQGLTDALFPGSEALTELQALRRADPDYPIKLFLGDIGHDYAAERVDEWDLAKGEMNAFVDHFLRPDRTPTAPRFDVRATVTRCLDHDAPMRSVVAEDWAALHPGQVTLSSRAVGHTSTEDQGPDGTATDPISTATLGGPKSYKGCRIVRPARRDPTVATYDFAVDRDLLVVGGPVVRIGFDTTGPDTPLSVRVWDVAPGGGAKGLVTRGTFRVTEPPGPGRVARFQLGPLSYRFAAGHTLEVQVTANDAPYMLANNQAAEVTVHRLDLTLPLHESTPTGAAAPTTPEVAGEPGTGNGGDGTTWLVIAGAVLALLAGAAVLVARRRRT